MAETDLVVVEKLNAIELFTGDAMDPLIAQIRAIVDKHVPDVSTDKGRKEVASLARRVASSKVILDDLGKSLVADWKEKAKRVDIVRKKMRDDLDALRDTARLPLTQYELQEAERLRQEEAERRYASDWDEAHTMHELFERERVVREKEAEMARQEAERKAREEAERLERERKEWEAQIARDAADRARREAEETIRREQERAERAEREKAEAAEGAKREQEAAVREAEQKAKERAEREEAARQAEIKAEQDRKERLAANKRHREKIEREAIASATAAHLPDPEAWIAMISAGKITNVTMNY